jgi:hypothetical protein
VVTMNECGKIDANESVSSLHYCPECGKLYPPQGYDPCWGLLPNVKEACCGHGIKDRDPYILLNDNTRLIGKAAITYAQEHRMNRSVKSDK